MINLKKGAMFGLDARIALAIFGALSIISGAALYSAIEKVNVEKNARELIEISKAYEEYYLFSGVHQGSPAYLTFNVTGNGPLLESGMITGLNRPLISTFKKHLNNPNDDPNVQFWQYKSAEWPENAGVSDPSCDTSIKGDCYQYLRADSLNGWIDEDSALKDIIKLDEYFDNSDGPNLGKIRYFHSHTLYLYFKIMPY